MRELILGLCAGVTLVPRLKSFETTGVILQEKELPANSISSTSSGAGSVVKPLVSERKSSIASKTN